jgi:hypothetical protein
MRVQMIERLASQPLVRVVRRLPPLRDRPHDQSLSPRHVLSPAVNTPLLLLIRVVMQKGEERDGVKSKDYDDLQKARSTPFGVQKSHRDERFRFRPPI